MLEELINVKLAIRHNKPKSEVKDKFLLYTEAYDEAERNVGDKIRHRELFLEYVKYMSKSEK